MELSSFTNLFANLQEYVANILNNDEILTQMGASFLAENSLDIEYELKNALNKQGLACAVMTPKAKYQGHNGIQQTFTCDELTLQIVENPIINRARLKKNNLQYGTGLDVAKAASDRLAGPQGGYFGKFTTKNIQESEVGGLLVVTVTFGCTVYENLSAVPSGDISGHWVEVPFVRISELSSWLSSWISANVDLEPYREKLDLSVYQQDWYPWTGSNGKTFTYDGPNSTWGTIDWASRSGLTLGWQWLVFHPGDDDHERGWYWHRGEMAVPDVYLGGDWDSTSLTMNDVTFTRDGVNSLSVVDMLAKESQLSGYIPASLSSHLPYIPLSVQNDLPYIPLSAQEDFRTKTDLSTYTISTIVDVTSPWTVQQSGQDPVVLEWDEGSSTWHDSTSEVELLYDGANEAWYINFYSQYATGTTYAPQDALELEFDVDGSTVTAQRQSSGQVLVPDGDSLAKESELSSYCLQEYAEDIDRMKREKTDLSAYKPIYSSWTSENGGEFQFAAEGNNNLVWSGPKLGQWSSQILMRETESDTNRWNILAAGRSININGPVSALRLEVPEEQQEHLGAYVTRPDSKRRYVYGDDRIALVNQDLSALRLQPWQNQSLSASHWEAMTMVRTYDNVEHWLEISGTNTINQTIFNRFGFDYTDNALSGIKDVVFGKALYPHTTFNFTNSKVQHIWYPSHLSSFGSSQVTNCSELKTVMLADYTPGNMDKTFFLRARSFYNCPNLCRIEVPALSVFTSGVGHFHQTPLSSTIPERPDILPGVWLYGYLSGETHARQTLSAIWDTITPDKIHVAPILGTPVDSGEYLPLSGGTLSGTLGIPAGTNVGIKFGSDRLWWGPGGVTFVNESSETDDYCIFPVGYGAIDEPNVLVKKGYVDDIIGDISTLIHET